jgi:hypothetical protein
VAWCSVKAQGQLYLYLYKASIQSTLTYACPAWEFAADSCLLKLQRMRNKVMHTIGNLPRRSQTRDLHFGLKIPYIYDFVTELCRQQVKVTLNHENVNICDIGQGEAQHRKYKRFKLGGGQTYDRSIV